MQGRLLDLCFFDITNLFCPRRYVLKDVVRDSNGQRGLTFFISILQPNIDVNACSQQVHDAKDCQLELYDVINMLCLNCDGYSMHEGRGLAYVLQLNLM